MLIFQRSRFANPVHALFCKLNAGVYIRQRKHDMTWTLCVIAIKIMDSNITKKINPLIY